MGTYTMAAIPTQSFLSIVQTIAAGVQGRATQILDFSVGSVLRAIAEGFASICLWLQTNILQVALLTRAATSNGPDLDSWMNDWNFVRLSGTFATGAVTFSRNTASSSAPFIPIGATVSSADGSQTFTVITNTASQFYTATPVAGYTMPANIASITIPVQCSAVGSQGNVQAGTISQITTPLTGIDTVINTSALVNGQPAETDPQFRSRFISFIASLSKATDAAIAFAVTSLAPNIQATVTDNQNPDGTTNNGFVTVTVDDGSGTPSSNLLTSAASAVQLTRAAGVMANVFPPIIINVTIAVVIVSAVGYQHQTVVGTVGTAVQNYVNTLGLGNSLYYNKLSQIIFESSPGVTNITTLAINGTTLDVTATNRNTIKIGTLTVA